MDTISARLFSRVDGSAKAITIFFLKGRRHTAVCHTYTVLRAGQYSIGPCYPGVGLGDPRRILTVQFPSCSFHCGMTGCDHCSGFWMVPQSIRNSGGRVYLEQILRPCIRHILLDIARWGGNFGAVYIRGNNLYLKITMAGLVKVYICIYIYIYFYQTSHYIYFYQTSHCDF